MVKVLFATRNGGKQREIRRLLAEAGMDLVFPEDVGIAESAAEDLLELHDSFQGNARAKAEYFSKASRLPTVAEDSGLEVLSLGGAPGVKSRRWAGATGSAREVDAANNALLLQRLTGAPDNRRRGRYRCVLAWYRAYNALPEFYEGACSGLILAEPRGDGGFGYDPLFLSDDLGVTFGEASPEQKDEVSHRGRAIRAWLAGVAHHPL